MMKENFSLVAQSLIKGKLVRLPCIIYNELKDYTNVDLIFDTGANRTTIRKDHLQKLKYNNFPISAKKTTIGNDTTKFEQSKLFQIKVNGILFYSINLINTFDPIEESMDYHGVIGMDIISKLETYISFEFKSIIIASNQEHFNRELNKIGLVLELKDKIREYEVKIMELEEEINQYKKEELDGITTTMSGKNKSNNVPKSSNFKDTRLKYMNLKTRND